MKIGIITDIHEDVVSLKKALRIIEKEKCDEVVCLGDIIGYPFMRAKYESTRNISETIHLIKTNCSNVVLGNHDIFHIKKIPEFSSSFVFPQNWFNLSPGDQTFLSKNKIWNYSDDYPIKLTDNEYDYLTSLPELIIKNVDNIKLLLSHYICPEFSGYVATSISESKRLKEHFYLMQTNDCKISMCGHMHIEGIGICYDERENIFSKIFKGFLYYSYRKIILKNKLCTITVPALANNGQVNGFTILDTNEFSINAFSLSINRRFML